MGQLQGVHHSGATSVICFCDDGHHLEPSFLAMSIRMTSVWKWVLVRQISYETLVVQVRSTFYQAKASDWTDVSGESGLVLFKSLQARGLITGESRSAGDINPASGYQT